MGTFLTFEVEQAYASPPPTHTNAGQMLVDVPRKSVGIVDPAPYPGPQKVVIDGGGVFGFGVLWMLVIVGTVEAVKRSYIAMMSVKLNTDYEPGPVYDRILPLVPVLAGIGTAPVFGVETFEALSLHLTMGQAMWFGPIAGAGAGWCFVALKPVLRKALPSIFAKGVKKVTGVDVSSEIPITDEPPNA